MSRPPADRAECPAGRRWAAPADRAVCPADRAVCPVDRAVCPVGRAVCPADRRWAVCLAEPAVCLVGAQWADPAAHLVEHLAAHPQEPQAVAHPAERREENLVAEVAAHLRRDLLRKLPRTFSPQHPRPRSRLN